jgi:hypothetical protein
VAAAERPSPEVVRRNRAGGTRSLLPGRREFQFRPEYDRIRVGFQQIPSLFQGSRVGGDPARVGVVVREVRRQVNAPPAITRKVPRNVPFS